MSIFNPDAFLDTAHEGSLDTQMLPIPEGEFDAQVKELKARAITDKSGNERALMDVVWTILDESVAKELGRDNPTVRQTIFLDLTDEGNLDMGKGKNTQLGQLRDALGQNKGNKQWKPSDMVSKLGTVAVSHRPDPDDDTKVYSQVKRVTSPS